MAYRTVHTHFWTDPAVRALPPDGKMLFLYLITNPHAHLSGLYYLPISSMAHETGLKPARIDTLLRGLAGVQVDDTTGLIWVKRMFAYQGKGEKAQRSAANHLGTLHNSFLIKAFLNLYPAVRQFCKDTLLDTVSHTVADTNARVGPPNQDQEKDQDQDSGTGEGTGAKRKTPRRDVPSVGRRKESKPAKSSEAWGAYEHAYRLRYHADPIQNAQNNSLLCQLVDRVGAETAPLLAAYYLTCNARFYVENLHPLRLLLRDYQGIHTQMVSGLKMTSLEARTIEQRDNAQAQLARLRSAEVTLEGRPHGSA